MKYLLTFILLGIFQLNFAQVGGPNNCIGAVSGCTTPSFAIAPPNPLTDIVDFGTGTVSNPSINPQGVNAGCLLTGETSSTFITISVVSSGTLAWSIQGPTAGCFDWIMWPYVNSTVTCAAISGGTLPPVACNWNGACGGFTGMAPAGALPAGASATDFQPSIVVTAGQQFLLCLSNFSSTSQNVNLNFFGTANIACQVTVPNRTICLGATTNVTVSTPGYTNPQFQWLNTAGVSNPTGGTNVAVTPTVTTNYAVAVFQPASPTTVAFFDTAYFTVFVATPPTPNAGIDDTVCFGATNGVITLNGTDTTGGNRIKWSFSAPTIVPAPLFSYLPNDSSLVTVATVTQPGVYNFILKETNQYCGVVEDTVRIFLKRMTVEADSVSPTCFGFADGEILITGLDATEYSYDNSTTWTPNASLSTFAAGTYTVCARDINSCSACTTITIIEPDPVEIFVSNDTLICENGIANLLATATGDTAYNFNWTLFPNAPGYTAFDNQFAAATTATYYLVRAETASGCLSAWDSIYVTVRQPITGIISPNTTICPGYSATLVATGQGGFGVPYNFVWSNGTGGTGGQNSSVVSPAITQAYSVTITDNCESTPLVLNNEITVAPEPVPSFTTDANELCEPAVFTLKVTTDTATYTSASWAISNGQFYANVDTVVTDALSAGSYNVELILSNGFGCVDSVTYPAYLVSHPLPTAAFKFSPGQPTMFNTTVTFDNFSSGALQSQWTFESGTPASSAQNTPVVIFPEGTIGNYQVNLIVSSDFGCQDTVDGRVDVIPEVLLYAPNSFTPDGDEFNPTWRVHIEGIDVMDFNLEVRDRWGQVIWQSFDVDGEWDGTYKNELLPSGSYSWFIRVKDLVTDKPFTFRGSINIIR